MLKFTTPETIPPHSQGDALFETITLGDKVLGEMYEHGPGNFHACLFVFGRDSTPLSGFNLIQGHGATREEAVKSALARAKVAVREFTDELCVFSGEVIDAMNQVDADGSQP